jgi:hypothetical protein
LGFLCGILLSWWVNNVEVVLSPYLRPDGIWYALLAGFVLYVAFVVWAIVGVWRAAGKSIEKGRRGWPWIARFIVSAAACLFVYNFYAGITGAPLLVSSQDRAVDRATMPSVASVLKAIERQWLDRLPQKIDTFTELTTISALGNTLNFYYAVAPDKLFAIRFEHVRERVLGATCKTPADVNLLGRGTSYHYWYSDGITQHVEKFAIRGADCQCLKRNELGDCTEGAVANDI